MVNADKWIGFLLKFLILAHKIFYHKNVDYQMIKLRPGMVRIPCSTACYTHERINDCHYMTIQGRTKHLKMLFVMLYQILFMIFF